MNNIKKSFIHKDSHKVCTKRKYGSKNICESELKRFQDEGIFGKDKVAYHCKKCLGWHIGKTDIK